LKNKKTIEDLTTMIEFKFGKKIFFFNELKKEKMNVDRLNKELVEALKKAQPEEKKETKVPSPIVPPSIVPEPKTPESEPEEPEEPEESEPVPTPSTSSNI